MILDPADPLVLPTAIIDIGAQKRGRIRRLRQSSGALSRRLAALAGRICEAARLNDARDVIPVVLLYECVDDPPAGRLLPKPVPGEAASAPPGEPA
ncbi:hypothetical protein [Methylobacterium nonmethylotrophicum]|uniref:Uncharacterized protein n=1 Tax=Methylobacterium nonmethylotrophicum TaxID=1141884 RepID=A0A4Z0NQW1_9HYPH|nr:hypothetical protein [Methylobacterium nonmethylotrophicum]TGD98915.1 hypothetical protein EU555_13450 [Methylobacterium nonmethylotrophicum]